MKNRWIQLFDRLHRRFAYHRRNAFCRKYIPLALLLGFVAYNTLLQKFEKKQQYDYMIFINQTI